MCLITKNEKPLISKKEITCYKILETPKENDEYSYGLKKISRKKGEFYTPYIGKKISGNILEGKRVFKACGEKYINYFNFHDGFEIGCGFIHTYKSFESVKENVLNMRHNFEESDFYVFECVIPKNVEYYEGTYELTNDKSYASEKIRFVKKLEV